MNALRLSTCVCSATLWLLACNGPQSPNNITVTPPEKFSEHVRTTEFQTPEQELVGFTVPKGFEVTLFASEPDIGKPMNIDFDAAGRLWVTQSAEYPLGADSGKGKDRITILEDKDGDGRADTFTHFADGLNIPIGIIPVQNGAIAYSIPAVYRFTDTNGDGKADQQKELFGEFGHRDTHGMVSNLIRGFDGWVHACHGFTNTSTIAGTDGDSITMTSGNTFRFKIDGSRVEQTTFGRVNPFGYAFDEWGYLYSIDCHTKPIYQLIKGGDYPHFGKKAPGIGFAPEMMGYELGSTALSGLVYYIGDQYPKEYQNSFYSGDVVTCRINRNTMSFHGSSPESKRQQDFLISNDPWFRPVNVKMGPDGALYVADFYNRIIGHYEVPLDHPGRDRKSGRIWKISYKGNDKTKTIRTDWSKADARTLVANLNHPQLNTRMMIADQLVDRVGSAAIKPVTTMISAKSPDPKSYVQGIWILFRLRALHMDQLAKALQSSEPVVRVHALRILNEQPAIDPRFLSFAADGLLDKNPHIQRIAAELLGHNIQGGDIPHLLDLYNAADTLDSHLSYTTLLSIRDRLRHTSFMSMMTDARLNEQQQAVLVKAMMGVPNAQAALFTLNYIQSHTMAQPQLITCLEHIGRYLPEKRLPEAIAIIRQKFATEPDIQFTLYTTMRQGIAQRGSKPGREMQQWALGLASAMLGDINPAAETWKTRPVDSLGGIQNAWGNMDKKKDDVAARYLSSDWRGDVQTGVLYSTPFALPATMSLSVFDNDVSNRDEKSGLSANAVRVRLAATNQVVGEYRLRVTDSSKSHDLFKEAHYNLSAFKGQPGYIEIIDSSKKGAIAVAFTNPSLPTLPPQGPGEKAERQISATEIITDYQASAFAPVLSKLAFAEWADFRARLAAGAALSTIAPRRYESGMLALYNKPGILPAFREKLTAVLGQSPSPTVLATLQKSIKGSSRSMQIAIARVLSQSKPGITHLLVAVGNGSLDAGILSELDVKERLMANIQPAQQQELSRLTAGMATGREDREKIIEERLAAFDPKKTTAANGHKIFIQNCSMCHQVKGTGGVVGPQLNGIGNWGRKALTEKILDPNRNIAESFRNYNITLKNGKLLSGLYRRSEGELLVFANPDGKEFTVQKNDIRESKASLYTLMPDQFSRTIEKNDFDNLLAFLLTLKE